MREQVGSAVTTDVVGRATSFLVGKCNEHKSIDEMLDRLEMVVIRIKSVVGVSEEFDINIEPLEEWQEKLKEALSEADEMLCHFKAKALPEKVNQTVEGRSSSHDLREAATLQVDIEAKLRLATTLKHLFYRLVRIMHPVDSPWPAIIERLSEFARVLDPKTFSLLNPRMTVNKYLENDEKVSKLIKTVEKLEKMAGDIGDFIELLKLQSKRKMCRKRKRSAHRGVFLVSLNLPIAALHCFGGVAHLLVIKLLVQIVLI